MALTRDSWNKSKQWPKPGVQPWPSLSALEPLSASFILILWEYIILRRICQSHHTFNLATLNPLTAAFREQSTAALKALDHFSGHFPLPTSLISPVLSTNSLAPSVTASARTSPNGSQNKLLWGFFQLLTFLIPASTLTPVPPTSGHLLQ